VRLAHAVGVGLRRCSSLRAPWSDQRACLTADSPTCPLAQILRPHVGVLYGKRFPPGYAPRCGQPQSGSVALGNWNSESRGAGLVAMIDLAEPGLPRLPIRRETVPPGSSDAAIHHERELCEQLVTGLLQIWLNPLWHHRSGSLCLADPNRCSKTHRTPYTVAKALGDRGIFTWNNLCTQPHCS